MSDTNSKFSEVRWGKWLGQLIGTAIVMAVIVHICDTRSCGEIANAEAKLSVGQTYECVTSLASADTYGWVGVVKCENKLMGLRFSSQPPIKGVVAMQKDEVVFLPLADVGGTSQSSLAEKLAK